MNHHFERLIRKAGERASLSSAEREKMRFVLTEYLAFRPAKAAPAVPRHRLFFLYVRRPVAVALSAFLTLGIASGGVAYAAEGTLPGDTLYPVKVDVTEPVRTALTFSSSDRAAWQMTLAERRITEAATLAQKGALSTSTENELAANFSANASAAAQAIGKQQHDDPEDATIAAASFSARLSGYNAVLAQVGSDDESGTTTILQDAIDTQIEHMSGPRVAAIADATTTLRAAAAVARRPSLPPEYLAHLKKSTGNALRASASLLASASSTLDASTSASARGQFDSAAESAARGVDLLEQHDDQGAFQAFQDSLSATAKLDVLTRASAQLKINAFGTDGSSDPHEGSGRHTRHGDGENNGTPSGETGSSSGETISATSSAQASTTESSDSGDRFRTPSIPQLPNLQL